ncbi:oligoendopeptidase F [Roseburia sp. MUC/MUC-530-WT-4D]|uniref:Oligopeptidase F n=1 Tax=Roseburia porci TaxID=2605790 RepID=A0A6L5YP83_9FIRM|nr:oligoendopeptidase F [Roseburia porci]MCI5515870.1 oligoendopeptidase F [Roseburia sp.]MDD6741973.1 oligoendopeptidase F [Roseburia porci]MST74353.1 oligoendopeptidase F [Roseburia porci]
MNNNKVLKRDEISDEYKWNLEDMFASDALWEEEYEQTKELCNKIASYQGKLTESAATLLAYFQDTDEANYHLERIYVYANERYHQDTAVSKYQGYASRADSLMVMAESSSAFAEPEILEASAETINAFYKEQPELLKYQRAIDEILRKKAHTLSKEEEKILANAGEIAVGPENIFSMFNNADIRFPAIKDAEGNELPVSHGTFIQLMENKDRNIRKQAFESMYHTYQQFGNTVASIFTSHLKQEHFFAKTKKYDSVRAMHLDQGNIPEGVYDNLIETVHKHLPAMHRYMAERKKLLGVEELHMYDLYTPLIDDYDKKYTYEEAKETVLKGLAPMGEEYLSILKEGLSGGWIDVYENENKRSGAYSWGAYGTHPYVLLNHKDNLNSVFTLAHEMGHAIHTYYSNKTQPITYSGYLIFVAEVASTCNEALLMQYLMKNAADEKERRYLINHQLEEFRTTLFRQTMFAEFEQIVHKKIADGEALTQEALNKIYHDLNVLYYGPDVVVDEEIDYEWMRIPHFYTSFYVYQYATGYSAATAFSKLILEGGQPAVDRYVTNFLCGGCSKDPIELLKNAGVDMSTPEPVDAALQVFEEYLAMFTAK